MNSKLLHILTRIFLNSVTIIFFTDNLKAQTFDHDSLIGEIEKSLPKYEQIAGTLIYMTLDSDKDSMGRIIGYYDNNILKKIKVTTKYNSTEEIYCFNNSFFNYRIYEKNDSLKTDYFIVNKKVVQSKENDSTPKTIEGFLSTKLYSRLVKYYEIYLSNLKRISSNKTDN